MSSLEDLVAEVVARHPELVQAALERAATAAAVTTLSELSLEETPTSPDIPDDKSKAGAVPVKKEGKDATSRAVPAELPFRQYCPLFTVDSA